LVLLDSKEQLDRLDHLVQSDNVDQLERGAHREIMVPLVKLDRTGNEAYLALMVLFNVKYYWI